MSDDTGSATTADLLQPAIAAAVATQPAGLAPGADPDEVRDWFDLETIVDLPVPAASFAEAEAAAAEYRRAARAENTRRAYRAAVAAFTDWCAAHAQTALPASPETVAAFLAAEAGRGLAVNTLRLRHAGLRYLHLLAGYPPPTASPLVSATFAGIRRAHRRPLRKKTALVLDPLRAAVQGNSRHPARAARPRASPGRLCRGIAAERIGGADSRTPEPARRWHRPVAAMAQERSGGTGHKRVVAGRTDRFLPGNRTRSLARDGRDRRGPAVPAAVASAATAGPPRGRDGSR